MKPFFIPIDRVEDIEVIAGKLVKSGHRVERAKVKIGKSYRQGIEVTVSMDIKALETEDDE